MLYNVAPNSVRFYHEIVRNVTKISVLTLYSIRVCKFMSRAMGNVALHLLQFIHGRTSVTALKTSGRLLILISTLKFSSLKFAHGPFLEGRGLPVTGVEFHFLAFIQFRELMTRLCT